MFHIFYRIYDSVQTLVDAWFLPRASKKMKDTFRAGHIGEMKAKRELPSFLESHTHFKMEELFEVGLFVMTKFPFIGASTDGLMILKRPGIADPVQNGNGKDPAHDEDAEDNERFLCALVTANSEAEVWERVPNRCFVQVVFDSHELKTFIPVPEYRTQVRHHATVLQVDHVLYVETKSCMQHS